MVVPFSDVLSQHSHVSADGQEDTGLQAVIWSTGGVCYIPSSSTGRSREMERGCWEDQYFQLKEVERLDEEVEAVVVVRMKN